MGTCPVCGTDLPAQRGPRARRYCSRACQAKAYRSRQRSRDEHRQDPAAEEQLLAEYADVPAVQLADQLASAARRLALALTAGLPADDFDLGEVARVPLVLAARTYRAAPAAQAVHGLPAAAAPSVTAVDLAAPASEPQSHPERARQTTRDDSRTEQRTAPAKPRAEGFEARPQKLSAKKAAAVADAAELVRHPEWRENHRWILRSGETVLGYVEPSYGGTSPSGRNGWRGRLANSAAAGRDLCPTRQAAAVQLAQSWIRLVTTAPRRTLTVD